MSLAGIIAAATVVAAAVPATASTLPAPVISHLHVTPARVAGSGGIATVHGDAGQVGCLRAYGSIEAAFR